MKYFIGLDVSMKDTNVCIVDQDANIVKEIIVIRIIHLH